MHIFSNTSTTLWWEYKNELAGIHKTQDELAGKHKTNWREYKNELAGILSMGLEPMASSLLDSRSNQLS